MGKGAEMSEICREKTLLEELRDLDIDEKTKERLCRKCENLMKELGDYKEWLSNSHHYNGLAERRINKLEMTLANMCVKQFGKSDWQYDEKEQNK